jgi:flagellar hook protein FlgE
LAIAKFSNPSGLMKAGGNLFQQSLNSGTPNIGVPGDGRGTIMSSALEMSNVDLSEEFTEMIVAQRGFQANTRIITTSDEILQELVNLKR